MDAIFRFSKNHRPLWKCSYPHLYTNGVHPIKHVRVLHKRTFRPKKSPTCSNVEIFDHDPQQFDFQNDTWYVCFKSELLVRQKEKSCTWCNFEIFDHDHQLYIKFETWYKILKPIRILVNILIICIGTCIPYLCTVKV